MIKSLNLKDIMFVDIETIPQNESYKDVPPVIRDLWDKKAFYLAKNEETPEEIYNRAGIYAEFGRVICISVGVFNDRKEGKTFLVKSFYGEDEVDILTRFTKSVEKFLAKRKGFVCAHNGKEFDFPFLSRRMIINGLPLPEILDVAGRKPWEVPFLDTMELWKFGDYKHYTSLHLLTTILNIPTPKDDIDGSMVADTYYKQKDLLRIVRYCEKDVVAVAQILQRFRGDDILVVEDVDFVDA